MLHTSTYAFIIICALFSSQCVLVAAFMIIGCASSTDFEPETKRYFITEGLIMIIGSDHAND